MVLGFNIEQSKAPACMRNRRPVGTESQLRGRREQRFENRLALILLLACSHVAIYFPLFTLRLHMTSTYLATVAPSPLASRAASAGSVLFY